MGYPYYGHMRMHKLPPKKPESAPNDLGEVVGIGGIDMTDCLNGLLPPPPTILVFNTSEAIDPQHVDQWLSSITPALSVGDLESVVPDPAPSEPEPVVEAEPAPTPAAETWSPYWSKAKLMEYAAAQGMELPAGATKVEIVAALEAASNKQE